MDAKQRLNEFLAIYQKQNGLILKGWPIKETATNLGLYALMLLVTALYVALGIAQVLASLIEAGCNLVAKGLGKITPVVKEA